MAREFIPANYQLNVPSNTLAYFVREALRRIWVSKRTSFVAIAMIAISLVIVGGFLLVAENLQRAVVQAEGKSRVTVYFSSDARPEHLNAVNAYLAAHPDLARRHFISRDEALRRFRTYFTNLNDVIGQLDENPFPASFEIDVAPAIVKTPAFTRQIDELRAMGAVDDVQYEWAWAERLRHLVNLINGIGLAAGGILAVAAAFTIANVIRLAMLRYRKEIEIMRLVGATERIIRGPFLIEGILQGTFGGIVAIAILFGAFVAMRRMIAPASSLMWGFLFAGFLPWQKLLGLVAGGMLAGYIGSWVSVHETPEETL
jgi:cell division transport system permease protein